MEVMLGLLEVGMPGRDGDVRLNSRTVEDLYRECMCKDVGSVGCDIIMEMPYCEVQ